MLGIPEVIVPPLSGHHLGDRACSPPTSSTTPSGPSSRSAATSISTGSTRDFAAMEAQLRGAVRRRRHRPPARSSFDALRRSALRRPGLRAARADSRTAPLDARGARRRSSSASTSCTSAEYGHRFADEPDRDRQHPGERRRPDAEDRRARRAAKAARSAEAPRQDRPVRRSASTAQLERVRRPRSTGASCCRSASAIAGPGHHPPDRQHDRRAARLHASTADAAGNLIIAIGGDAMSDVTPDRARQAGRAHRSDHRQRDPGRAREHRDRDGLQAHAHVLLEHHPRVRGLRRGADRRRRAGSCARSRAEHAAAVRARSPATCAASAGSSTRAARTIEPGRRDHAQRPLWRRLATAPTWPSVVPVFHGGDAGRLLGHDRASPRHRRAHAGQLRHRRRDRRLRRGPAVQGDQGLRGGPDERRGLAACCATTSAPPTWWSATWRRRSPRPGSAPSAIVELIERYGLDTVERRLHEDLMDYSERLMRAAIARAARRRLPRRRPTSTATSTIRRSVATKNLPIVGHHHRARATRSRSTSPARRRRCPTGRSTCRSRARSTSRSG